MRPYGREKTSMMKFSYRTLGRKKPRYFYPEFPSSFRRLIFVNIDPSSFYVDYTVHFKGN